MNHCVNCKKETSNRKFCSLSCSASHNNKGVCRNPGIEITNPKLYDKAISLRKEGYGYRLIASKTGICCGTVKNIVKHIPAPDANKLFQKSRETSLLNTKNLNCNDAAKKVLVREFGHQCMKCNLSEWNDEPIILELEHINGDTNDYNHENLELLCPNCHSQTPTWRRIK